MTTPANTTRLALATGRNLHREIVRPCQGSADLPTPTARYQVIAADWTSESDHTLHWIADWVRAHEVET